MKEKTLFLNMFSDYMPPEPLQSVLSQAAICAADLDPVSRTVDICLECPEYIPQWQLNQISEDVESLYGLAGLNIEAVFPADQLQKIAPDEILFMFVRQNSMFRGSLAGAIWEWEGNTLVIRLRGNGKKELEEAAVPICRELSHRFGTPVEIRIEAGNALEGDALFEAMMKMRYEQLVNIKIPEAEPKSVKQEAAPVSEAIFGKPFKGEVTPMKDAQLDMGGLIVEGKVFAIDHKELKKRNAWSLALMSRIIPVPSG